LIKDSLVTCQQCDHIQKIFPQLDLLTNSTGMNDAMGNMGCNEEAMKAERNLENR
jgi:hypothetical protein